MDTLVQQLRSADFWLRLVFTLIYLLLWGLAESLLTVLTLLQLLLRLVRGKPSRRLAAFGSSLAQFVWQTAAYLTAASEQKPWPFLEWPAADAVWRRTLPKTSSTADKEVE